MAPKDFDMYNGKIRKKCIFIIMVHVCGIGTPSRAVASVINIVVLVGMVWCICLFSKQWACLFVAHCHKVCDILPSLPWRKQHDKQSCLITKPGIIFCLNRSADLPTAG